MRQRKIGAHEIERTFNGGVLRTCLGFQPIEHVRRKGGRHRHKNFTLRWSLDSRALRQDWYTMPSRRWQESLRFQRCRFMVHRKASGSPHNVRAVQMTTSKAVVGQTQRLRHCFMQLAGG